MQGSLIEWLTMLGEWGIVGAILYEGRIALREYRSARLFDAIRYIEAEEPREARRILYEKIVSRAPQENRWWEGDAGLANAASATCARYNLLGAVTNEDTALRKFIVREWANNICWTYEALEGYLNYREHSKTGRPGMFRHYTALYRDARQQAVAKESN